MAGLSDVFAANDRRRRKEMLAQAAEQRAKAQAQKAREAASVGGLVGGGLGAAASLVPGAQPFAPALIGVGSSLGQAVGKKVAGGEISAEDGRDALAGVTEVTKDKAAFDALRKLLGG